MLYGERQGEIKRHHCHLFWVNYLFNYNILTRLLYSLIFDKFGKKYQRALWLYK